MITLEIIIYYLSLQRKPLNVSKPKYSKYI